MHPELVILLADQRIAELHERSGRRPRRASWVPQRPVRRWLGRRLVRWGHRLDPATAFAGASPRGRRPATMGP